MTTATPPLSPGASRPNRTVAGANTPGCRNCRANVTIKPDSWCPKCGYYPKLGRCVNLGTDAVPQQEELLDGQPLEIPGWFWFMVTGSIGIIVMSLIARFTVPADGPLAIWSLVQFMIGLTILGICHVQAFIVAAGQTDKLSPADIFLHPWQVWKPTLQELPETKGRVCNGTWGITAALCAMFVVGGMTEDQIGEIIMMGVEERGDQPNIMQRMMSGVRTGAGSAPGSSSTNNEEALDEFASTMGVDQFAEPEQVVEEQKPEMMCLVIGYTRNVAGDIKSLLLADIQEGSPRRFVGKILVDNIDDSVVNHVDVMIPRLAKRRGSIPCPIRAYWLEPEVLCLVEYDEFDEEHLLVGAEVISVESRTDDEQGEGDVNEDAATSGDAQPSSSSSSSSSSPS